MTIQMQELERVIPTSRICDALDCEPITFRRMCERHGVPIVKLSPSKHGLTKAGYELLLRRASGVEAA